MAVDDAGNIYFDSNSYVDTGLRVLRISAASGTLSTVAGTGKLGACAAGGGSAKQAALSFQVYLTVDGAGNLYESDYWDACIHRVDADSGILRTIAGTGTDGFSGDGGAATSARMQAPAGLAVLPSGAVVFADAVNNRLRLLTPVQ